MEKQKSIKSYGNYFDGDGCILVKSKFNTNPIKGINSNNGWLLMEENGLPQNGTKCHFIISGFEENEYVGHYEDGLFWDGKAAYTAAIVTHYQPIIKPGKPIY